MPPSAKGSKTPETVEEPASPPRGYPERKFGRTISDGAGGAWTILNRRHPGKTCLYAVRVATVANKTKTPSNTSNVSSRNCNHHGKIFTNCASDSKVLMHFKMHASEVCKGLDVNESLSCWHPMQRSKARLTLH